MTLEVGNIIKITDPNCPEYPRIGAIKDIVNGHPMLGLRYTVALYGVDGKPQEEVDFYGCEISKWEKGM